MTPQIGLVLAILVLAIVLFAWERLSVDTVALTVLAVLLALQLVTPAQAVSGLSNPATVSVAALFVVSAGLQKTGALLDVGRWLTRLGRRRIGFLATLMLSAAASSAFINNTPVVAVMLPMVMAVALRHKVNPSQWLIPLSFASQFGGVCTLVGTSTNLLVSAASEAAGHGAFSMFEFSRLGLILALAGMAYFLLLGRLLLPERPARNEAERYQLADFVTELRVAKDSPLIGHTLPDVRWFEEHGVRALNLFRDGRALREWRRKALREADVVLVKGHVKDLIDVKDSGQLELNAEFRLRDDAIADSDQILVEVLVAPRSRLSGESLSSLYFKHRYGLVVLALRRGGRDPTQALGALRLATGDALLLQGPPSAFDRLHGDADFIVLREQPQVHFFRGRAPYALGIAAAMVALATLSPMPIVAAALIAAVAMVLSGCLRIEDAYRAIDWRVIFLLAGILPLGIAMTESGAAQWIAANTLGRVDAYGPLAVLALLYLLTAALTESMSNNAAAVLLAPVALSAAQQLGVDPKPLLIAITFAASTAFVTPIGYQTNAMIQNPGGYRYTDFVRVGLPLNLLFWGLSVLLIPRLWPF